MTSWSLSTWRTPSGLFVLALLAGWLVAPWLAPSPSESVRARGTILASSSIARDGDLVLRAEDEQRAGERGVGPLLVRVSESGAVVPLGSSFLLGLAGAPFALVASGDTLDALLRALEVLLAALASIFASRALWHRLGDAAPLWVAALLFGSSAWLFGWSAAGDVTQFALALALGASLVGVSAAPQAAQIYQGSFEGDQEPLERGGVRVVGSRRFLAAGALAGALAFEEWILAMLLVPVLAAVGRRDRVAVVVGAGATLLLLCAVWVVLAGSAPWNGETRWLAESETVPREATSVTGGDLGRSVAERRGGPTLDPPTLAHASLQTVVGARSGLLVGALPLLAVLLLGAGRDRPSVLWRWSVGAFLFSIAALLLLRPYDTAGGPDIVGNRLLLPAVGLLGVVLVRRSGAGLALGVLLAGQIAQWPAQAERLDLGQRLPDVPSLRQVLPLETTQSLLGSGEGVMMPGSLWVRPWDETALRLRGGRWNQVSVGRAQPLDAVVLELSRGAPAEVEVRGAAVAELMLRPDDSVHVQLELGSPERRHETWWSDGEVSWYDLSIRLPESGEKDADPGSWGFSLRPGRMR